MIDIYEKLNEFKKDGLDAVIITVTSKEGMGPADVGKKLIINSNGEFFGTIGGGSIEHYAIEKAKALLIERKSLSEKYVLSDQNVELAKGDVKLNMACGGTATLFYEFVGPKQYVYIFGAGHCGYQLGKTLKQIGFHVVLVDNREELLKEKEDASDEVVLSQFGDFVKQKKLRKNAYVVVCTPSHQYDFAVLDAIIETKYQPAYFGMLCSKAKIKEYLELAKKKYGEVKLENFYSPIGLNIGGVSPEEIAVSISAEILAHYYQKDEINAHMKDK